MNILEMGVRSLSGEFQCGRTSLRIWLLLKWTGLAGPLTTEVEKQPVEALLQNKDCIHTWNLLSMTTAEIKTLCFTIFSIDPGDNYQSSFESWLARDVTKSPTMRFIPARAQLVMDMKSAFPTQGADEQKPQLAHDAEIVAFAQVRL